MAATYTIPYYVDVLDTASGLPVFADFDCELTVEVLETAHSEADELIIRDVWTEAYSDTRVELLGSVDPWTAMLGERVAAAAEADPRVWDRAMDAGGYVYRGKGGADPDGRWVRELEAAE